MAQANSQGRDTRIMTNEDDVLSRFRRPRVESKVDTVLHTRQYLYS